MKEQRDYTFRLFDTFGKNFATTNRVCTLEQAMHLAKNPTELLPTYTKEHANSLGEAWVRYYNNKQATTSVSCVKFTAETDPYEHRVDLLNWVVDSVKK